MDEGTVKTALAMDSVLLLKGVIQRSAFALLFARVPFGDQVAPRPGGTRIGLANGLGTVFSRTALGRYGLEVRKEVGLDGAEGRRRRGRL
jgi:hypothetical protein